MFQVIKYDEDRWVVALVSQSGNYSYALTTPDSKERALAFQSEFYRIAETWLP